MFKSLILQKILDEFGRRYEWNDEVAIPIPNNIVLTSSPAGKVYSSSSMPYS
jgi:hypothetical protein